MNLANLIKYAEILACRTKRYQFGGDDPIQGFDCSGYVIELLKSVGLIAHGEDMTAQGLFNRFEQCGAYNCWGPGALAFYGKDVRHITHVGFCIDSMLMFEAGGGDSTTTTDERAIQQNAFIRMRPIRYRSDFIAVIKPYYNVGAA